MARPVIFLDVDGVLNHQAKFAPGSGPDPLCSEAIQRFKELVKATDAWVVVSSSWRGEGKNSPHMQKLIATGALENLHEDWCTNQRPGKRGSQIDDWLALHPEHKNYVILDDTVDFHPKQLERHVRTAFEFGLQKEHCDRALRILKRT